MHYVIGPVCHLGPTLRGDSKRSLDLREFPLSGWWDLGLQLFLLPGYEVGSLQ